MKNHGRSRRGSCWHNGNRAASAAQHQMVQQSGIHYTAVMPRRAEESPDSIPSLTQEVLGLSREIQVLRETLDEIREYLQWITRNTDQFQIVVQVAAASNANKQEPCQKPKADSQGSLFE